jgi:hypothetical protein
MPIPIGAGLSVALSNVGTTKAQAEWSRGVSPHLLHFLSNGILPEPQLNSAAVHSYSAEQLASNYGGTPANIYQLARTSENGYGERGHLLSITDDGWQILAVSEPAEVSSNAGESFYLVPPGMSGEPSAQQIRRITSLQAFGAVPEGEHGARFVAPFPDGTVLLGRTHFIRVPLSVLLDLTSDLSVYHSSKWRFAGTNGEAIRFDCATDPRSPNSVWFDGNGKMWRGTFTGAGGVLNSDRMLAGSNVGDGPDADSGWPGGIAFGPDYYVWTCRSFRNDVVAFSPQQQDAAPAAVGGLNGNPTPARTLTSAVFSAINTNVEGLYRIDFDRQGGAWISSIRWADTQPSKAWHFSAAAMAQGGAQTPDVTLTNLMHHPFSLRIAPQFRLYAR